MDKVVLFIGLVLEAFFLSFEEYDVGEVGDIFFSFEFFVFFVLFLRVGRGKFFCLKVSMFVCFWFGDIIIGKEFI